MPYHSDIKRNSFLIKILQRKILSSFSVAVIGILLVINADTFATSMNNQEKISTTQDQKSVAITIYNENLALVKDLRHIKLDSDLNRLAWRDVSAQIRPETAILRSLNHSSEFRLVEQNFDFDLLTPTKILNFLTSRLDCLGTQIMSRP